MKNLVIAVDGPAGAGKSTIAKLIAEKLNINYIDTGAMYRAITYKCLQNNIDINNEEEVIKIAKDCEIDFKDNNIYLNGEILKDVNLEEIISDIIKRDEIDSNREFAPLVKADDAIEIDTTGKSINEVVQSVLCKINI